MADINNSESSQLINGTSEADSIINTDEYVTINADAGNDIISSWANSVTVDGGDGNDNGNGNGNGNDTIYGYNDSHTLQINSSVG